MSVHAHPLLARARSFAVRRPALLMALLIGLLLIRLETGILTDTAASKDALSNLTLASGLATTGVPWPCSGWLAA